MSPRPLTRRSPGTRNHALQRTLAVMLALREGRRTLGELADAHGVSARTIRRDIQALEAVHVPIRHGADEGLGLSGFWWIDRQWHL